MVSLKGGGKGEGGLSGYQEGDFVALRLYNNFDEDYGGMKKRVEEGLESGNGAGNVALVSFEIELECVAVKGVVGEDGVETFETSRERQSASLTVGELVLESRGWVHFGLQPVMSASIKTSTVVDPKLIAICRL